MFSPSSRQIGSISEVVLKVLISCSLGPLVSKVKEYQVETIVDTLCTNMLSDKEQLRDISSIGLKTVIGELPPASSGKTTCFPCVTLLIQLFPEFSTNRECIQLYLVVFLHRLAC